MAKKTEWFLGKGVELLARVPVGTFFDNIEPHGLEFQAHDLAALHKITASFPGVTWKKSWRRDLDWWEYTTEFEGVPLRIYAVRENPAECTPIYETKEVLVRWDCGEPEHHETR